MHIHIGRKVYKNFSVEQRLASRLYLLAPFLKGFYVKSADYKGTITARISNSEGGASFGEVTFKAKKIKEWTEFTGVLPSTGTAPKGQLALEFDAEGTVLVDYVSLFPQKTFKGRKNGLRPELAEMLIGLQPKFMRWPGGCIVEGATYENRIKWKETLGDPMTRRGEWDVRAAL